MADLIALQSELTQEYLGQLVKETPGSKAYTTFLGRALLAQPDNVTLRRLVAENPRSYRQAEAAFYPDGSDHSDESLTGELYYLVDLDERFVTLTAKGVEFLETRLEPVSEVFPQTIIVLLKGRDCVIKSSYTHRSASDSDWFRLSL